MLLISFLTSVCCRATCSVKLVCKMESNLENSASRFCNWRNLDLRALELNNIVLLLMKPFIASQRILGSSTEPKLKSTNSLNPVINWLIYASFFNNEVLNRHLAACLDRRPRVAELWSDRAIGSKTAVLIQWKSWGEAKRKSILEKDLCRPEKKV